MTATPLEKAYRRVELLLSAMNLYGEDTSVQSRPEASTVRVQRSWRIGAVTTAMYRGYTIDQLAAMDDAAVGARLRSDIEAMDRALVQRGVGAAVDRARALGMGWGDVLELVRL